MNSLYCSIALYISVWLFNEACSWVTIILFCHISRVLAHLTRKLHVDYTASRHIVLFYFRSERHHCRDKFRHCHRQGRVEYERHTYVLTHVCGRSAPCHTNTIASTANNGSDIICKSQRARRKESFSPTSQRQWCFFQRYLRVVVDCFDGVDTARNLRREWYRRYKQNVDPSATIMSF